MAKSLLFSCTLLVSSALVFLIEFTCAKMVLPSLGGSPAVWNTCLVFFQAGLLLGYAYAHLAPGRLGVRRHALVHVGLWLLACGVLWALPLDPAAAGKPPGEPIFWLLRLLTVSIGFPFVLLSSCGPLVQRWFAGSVLAKDAANNPYFLYTASNLGSLLGLVLYPFVIEPHLTLAQQNEAWTWTFLILGGLLAACGCWLMRPGQTSTEVGSPAETDKKEKTPPVARPVAETRQQITAKMKPRPSQPAAPKLPAESPRALRIRWVLLALAPSSLMLSVTSYLTTDIAPIPLMWMLPLALYLGSFVLVFSWHNTPVQAWMARWLPGVLLLVLVVPLAEGTEPILLVMAIHLLGFFWIALVCHGELARSKPAAEHLTEFYLWLAVGGVLGGMLNALAAPLLFNGIFEYPLVLVLTAWLNPGEENLRDNRPGQLEMPHDWLDLIVPALVTLLTIGLVLGIGTILPADRLSAALMFVPPGIVCLLAAHHRARFALGLGGLLLASGLYGGVSGHPILRVRSFFGVHRVTEISVDQEGRVERFHVLVHGNTIHGMQSLDPERRGEPLTYFHRDGPIGKFFESLSRKNDPRLERVGIVGLGAGALACYSAPRQHWTYFEIDPAVIRIASDRKLFTFLDDHKEQVDVILGDARLTLESRDEQSPGGLGKPLAERDRFGVIVIDAFGSDSIPLHLLTREALAIYRQRLKPGGVIVFHISSRYFDLEPILGNLAKEIGWTCNIRDDRVNDKAKQLYASTWVFMAEKPADLGDFVAPPARTDASLQPWTDDFSNVIQILKWSSNEG